jgi:hypothetical protein
LYSYLIVTLATASVAEPHHIDWTAIAAVGSLIAGLAALLSSLAAIVVAVFNPWIGYTKARLELLTEKLEKVYQLVKEERRIASELMIQYHSTIPTRTDSAEELRRGPAEDFRRFQAGNVDLDVFVNLFFPELLGSMQRCGVSRDQFVIQWYNLYNFGIEPQRLRELMNAEAQVRMSYDLLEQDIKVKARALSTQQTGAGLIKALGDLLKEVSEGTPKRH